jgi:hypothetical protein
MNFKMSEYGPYFQKFISYSFFDFNVFSFDIYVKNLFSKVFIHIIFYY